jgi:selenide,water dikinase
MDGDTALVQTVDVFCPSVDDPYTFGQIAAANSLSDVYAMGGRPLCAMNVVCFPAQKMDLQILRDILRGGADKIREAGAVVAGGHSIDDPEVKYGLAVTGLVHPDRILTNTGARPGDRLVLTKPLGTGIVATALKGGIAGFEAVEGILASMARLNREAVLAMESLDVHACTDVTGFGLVGHLAEMVADSEVGAVVYASSLPMFPEVAEYAAMGLLPGGLYRNRAFRAAMVTIDASLPGHVDDLVHDPQTSGGLLAALPADDAQALVDRGRAGGIPGIAIIGEVVASPAGHIQVRPTPP